MKRFLVILISVLMVFAMIPAMGYAADGIDFTSDDVQVTVTFSENPVKSYTGTYMPPLYPSVAVKNGTTAVPGGYQYKWKYYKNSTDTTGTDTTTFINPGVYKVVVCGTGSNTGEKIIDSPVYEIRLDLNEKMANSDDYRISIAKNPGTVVPKNHPTYDDQTLKSMFNVLFDSQLYRLSTDIYKLELVEGLEETGYTIRVLPADGYTSVISVREQKFQYDMAQTASTSIQGTDIELTDAVYVANNEIPDITVKVKKPGTTEYLREGIDYKVTYSPSYQGYIKGTLLTVTVDGDNANYFGHITNYKEITVRNFETSEANKGFILSVPTLNAGTAASTTATPSPTLKYYDYVRGIDRTLTNGTDYSIKYYSESACTTEVTTFNAGSTYYAKVTGIGNYTGSITKPFYVMNSSNQDKALSSLVPVMTVDSGTAAVTSTPYTGTNHTVNLTLKKGTEVQTTGFTVKYKKEGGSESTVTASGNIFPMTVNEAGAYTVTLTPDGDTYVGEKIFTFTVTPYDVKNAAVVINPVGYTSFTSGWIYEPKVISVTANLNGTSTTTLTTDTDYNVSYSRNTKRGMAKVIITGKGNYKGTKEIPFKIGEQTSITEATSVAEYTANFVPTPSVLGTTSYAAIYPTSLGLKLYYQANAASEKKLIPAADYTITFQELKTLEYYTSYTYYVDHAAGLFEPGTYYAKVDVDGEYLGTLYLPFTVGSAANISACTITQSIAVGTYTGSYITPPTFTVKFGSATLVENVDYTVTWKNSQGAAVNKSLMKDTGVYTATIAGKGNYSGSVEKSFIIAGTYIYGASVTLNQTTAKYDGSPKTVSVTSVMLGDTKLNSYSDYSVSITDALGKTVTSPKEIGTYTVMVTGKGKYSGTATATFTILGNADPEKTLKALELKVRTENQSRGIKVYVVNGTKDIDLSALTLSGYTVTYNFYNSTRNGNYKLKHSKADSWYLNTGARIGSKYYYKVIITVKDQNGKVVATNKLADCKYGCRTRKKV